MSGVPVGLGAGTGQWRVGDLVAGLYKVLEVHGEGAMGLVYRVRHLRWDVDLAVKSPRAELFRGDADRERFIREAQTWVDLGAHPHVCACYYVRTIDDVPRVFAEYVDGGSLGSRIDDGSLYRGTPREALERVLDIAVQVARGLAYTHEQGVVHQDVKPGNVMLDSGGTARVIDFGIARARQFGTAGPAPDAVSPRSALVTWAGMTKEYASPEQYAREPLSHGTDIWSFAVSVLEMFTGGVSWYSGTYAAAVLEDYLENGSPQPELPAMPAAVAALLRHCLRPGPGDRPDSMTFVAAMLAEAYERELGVRYPRGVADPVQLRADGLNNKALSLLDLGRVQEAREAFAQALAIDPQHPEALYNQGLLDWRASRLADDELVDRLELPGAGVTGAASERISILRAQVQLERSSPDEAEVLLEAALGSASRDPAVAALLSTATAMLDDYRRIAQRSVRFGLGDGVEAVAMTPDARALLTGGRGGRLVFHDLAADDHREFAGHQTDVQAVSLSADGTRALSGDTGGTVCLWNTASGAGLMLAEFKAFGASARACRLSADGRYAVVSSWDGTVRRWNTTSPQLPPQVFTPDPGVQLAISQGGLQLSADGQTAVVQLTGLELWDLPAGRVLARLDGHPLAMLPDASHALVAEGGYLAWYDLSGAQRGNPAAELSAPGEAGPRRPRMVRRLAAGPGRWHLAAVSADGRLAVSGNDDGVVRWWDLVTGRCLRTDHTDAVSWLVSLALSADGRTYALADTESVHVAPVPAFGGYTAPYEVCRPVSPAELTDRRDRFAELLTAARSVPGDRREQQTYDLLVQARALPGHERDEQALSAWHDLSCHLPRTGLRGAWPAGVVRLPGPGTQARLLPDGRRALCGDSHGLRLWDLDTGSCLQELGDVPVRSVALSPDQRTALSGSEDGRVQHWDLATGQCLMTMRLATEEPATVEALCFGADGRRCYAAADGQLDVWDLAGGSRVTRYRAYHRMTQALYASADGRQLLTCGTGLEVRMRDVADGRTTRIFRVNAGPPLPGTDLINDAGLTSDGGRVVTADNDGRVRIWQVDDAHLLHTVPGQEGPDGPARPMTAVSVCPDGRFAVAGDVDGLVRVLDLHIGRWLQTLPGHTDVVTSVHAGGQARYAVSTGEDGTLRRWELDWELDPSGVA